MSTEDAPQPEPETPPGGMVDGIRRAISGTGGLLRDAAAGVLNTTRFMADGQYRREVGYPWVKKIVADNWSRIRTEIDESGEMVRLLWCYGRGQTLTEAEQAAVRDQLKDLCRVVPALGIFLLPGGMLLLPLLARALPWNMMPSAWLEEHGIDPAAAAAVAEETVAPEDVTPAT